jgi:hypothetical protein
MKLKSLYLNTQTSEKHFYNIVKLVSISFSIRMRKLLKVLMKIRDLN